MVLYRVDRGVEVFGSRPAAGGTKIFSLYHLSSTKLRNHNSLGGIEFHSPRIDAFISSRALFFITLNERLVKYNSISH